MYSSCLEAHALTVNPKLKYKRICYFYFKITFNQLGLKDTHKVSSKRYPVDFMESKLKPNWKTGKPPPHCC